VILQIISFQPIKLFYEIALALIIWDMSIGMQQWMIVCLSTYADISANNAKLLTLLFSTVSLNK
jgi:hypothetical protein